MVRAVMFALVLAVSSAFAADEFDPAVVWAWTGNCSAESATVCAQLAETAPVKLVVALTPDLAKPVFESAAVTPSAASIVRVNATGLSPATAYFYGFSCDGKPLQMAGRLKTLPPPGKPATFTITLASCSETGAAASWKAIRRIDPLFHLCTGDLHYKDTNADNPELYLANYRTALARGEQGYQNLLWRSLPVAYVWDDHDYCGNASDKTSVGRKAAHAVYRQVVPHWPLQWPGAGDPIEQSFVVGRVRFVISDCRTNQSAREGEVLSKPQLNWLKEQAEAAAKLGQLMVWVSSIPWNGAPKAGTDRWQSYAAQRTAVADLIKAAGAHVCILSGDAHMVGIDDGRNCDFATGATAEKPVLPIPVFQAAALFRGPSYKGGPYNRGGHPGKDQFGVMEVQDDGKAITVHWSARNGADGVGEQVVVATKDNPGQPIKYSFTVPLPAK